MSFCAMAQEETESQRQHVSAMTSQFEAVIETESRAHYALRESMMAAEGPGEAARRESAGLDRARYRAAVRDTGRLRAEVHAGRLRPGIAAVESTWSWASKLTPTDVVEILNEEIDARLFRHRSRLGPKGGHSLDRRPVPRRRG